MKSWTRAISSLLNCDMAFLGLAALFNCKTLE
jgi:hypothetical protein